MLDQRDITAVDDEDRAHCISGQILDALKDGNYRGRSITADIEQL